MISMIVTLVTIARALPYRRAISDVAPTKREQRGIRFALVLLTLVATLGSSYGARALMLAEPGDASISVTAIPSLAPLPTRPSPINGVCGSANNTAASTKPTSNLCSVGSASTLSGTGNWTWFCWGINGGSHASCSTKPCANTCTSRLCAGAKYFSIAGGMLWGEGIMGDNYTAQEYCHEAPFYYAIQNGTVCASGNSVLFDAFNDGGGGFVFVYLCLP